MSTISADWFNSRIERREGGCWVWLRAVNPQGHGVVNRPNKAGMTTAHRFAWEQLRNGGERLARNVFVLQRCGQPLCVNPEHLHLGDVRVKNRNLLTAVRTIDEQWLAARTVKTERGCWEWTRSTDRKGYGKVCRTEADGVRRQTAAHRYVWEQLRNEGQPLPQETIVCHHCDNPPCCNPDHMFIGTQADNMQDMDRKGRRPAGSASHLAKLTQAQVDEIRRRYVPRGPGSNSAALALEFGIAQDYVSFLMRSKRWRESA